MRDSSRFDAESLVCEQARHLLCICSVLKSHTVHFRMSAPREEVTSPRMTRRTRVVIADDERLFRTSLCRLVSVPPPVITRMYGVDVGSGFEVVGEAGSGQETVEIVRAAHPDLLLLDMAMPRLSGLEALYELQECGSRTLVLSGTLDKPQLARAIQLGARGVVRKDAATELLFEAMTRVAAGASYVDQLLVSDLLDIVRLMGRTTSRGADGQPMRLTRREREVLSLVLEGCQNREIADQFAVSEGTVKHHLTRIFDKVGAANRVELALAATRHGLIN
jgi:two-component system nitrate/nitrite response regulator NarL